jgi:hypothetical protein
MAALNVGIPVAAAVQNETATNRRALASLRDQSGDESALTQTAQRPRARTPSPLGCAKGCLRASH